MMRLTYEFIYVLLKMKKKTYEFIEAIRVFIFPYRRNTLKRTHYFTLFMSEVNTSGCSTAI